MKKENIFTHKILPILSILILISFIFINNNIFASNIVNFKDINGVERSVPNFPSTDLFTSSNSYAIVKGGNYINTLYVATEDGFFYDNGGVKCSTNCYMVYIINDEYVVQPTPCQANARLCFASELCYFSTSLYSDINKSKVVIEGQGDFFPQAPVKEVTIPILEGVEQIPTAITTILKMIIPIGVIILSAVLVIYLIKSVIWRMK